MSSHADLVERTRAALRVRDSLVREGVEWLMARGVGPLSASLIMVWAIERATEERIRRREWPC